MNRKVLLVVGVGLLAATASTIFFYSIIVDSFGVEEEDKKAAVVVAVRDLPRGYQIAAADLKVEAIAVDSVPNGAYSAVGELSGQIIKLPVKTGDAIVPEVLISQGLSGISSAIPIGMRAVSVHVEEYAGVTEMVQMGDRVDVLVADAQRKPGDRFMALRTLLQNIEVLTTGRESGSSNGRGVIPVVTLLVEAKDSEAVSIADHAGSVRLVLRHPDDEGTDSPQGATLNDVVALGGSKLGRPRTQPSPRRAVSANRSVAPASQATKTVAKAVPVNANEQAKPKEPQSAAALGGQILLAVRFAALKQPAVSVLDAALDHSISAETFSVSTFRPDWQAKTGVEALVTNDEIEVFDAPNLLALDDTAVYFEQESQLSGAAAGEREPVGLKVSLTPKHEKDGSLQVTVHSTVVMPRDDSDEQTRELTRRSQCVVKVANGQSFWVRGLVEPARSAGFLKRLFPASDAASDEPLELAVLVTPSIADSTGAPLSASADD